MLFIFQRFLVLSILTIYLVRIDAGSTYEDAVHRSINGTSNDDDQKLLIILANYRHRFERSMNFKKMQWTFGNRNSKALCDACDLLVPEVMLSFHCKVQCIETESLLDASTNQNKSIRFD